MSTDTKIIVVCERCGCRCRVGGQGNPEAKMLRWAKGKGFCVNCATHDFLRNTYPINMQLAKSGPKILVHPHIRELFANIMRTAGADADPDEINWNLVNENWELPFAHEVKPRSDNPVTQKQLDEIKAGKYKAIDTPPQLSVCEMYKLGPIRSFEELNEIEPGLGDKLKNVLKNSKEKIMPKKTKGEQLDLINVAPKNAKEIMDLTRQYKKVQKTRLDALKEEVKLKEKIKNMVKAAELQPLRDGTIKFTYDGFVFKVTPRDELITIQEKKKRKTKKKA